MDIAFLIKECKNGSITAQKCLYDCYANRLFLFCRRYLKTDEEAEEQLQNGFLKIFKALSSFSYQSDVATIAWMKKIMVNECLQHLRKQHTMFIIPVQEAEEIIVDDLTLDSLEAAAILKIVTQLPIGYRTVFNLYEIEGYNHQEISKLLNITIGTSKSQLYRAKQLLRNMILQQNIQYGKSTK